LLHLVPSVEIATFATAELLEGATKYPVPAVIQFDETPSLFPIFHPVPDWETMDRPFEDTAANLPFPYVDAVHESTVSSEYTGGGGEGGNGEPEI
jgi:hypothetical protein